MNPWHKSIQARNARSESLHETFEADLPGPGVSSGDPDAATDYEPSRSYLLRKPERTKYLTFCVLLSLALHLAAIIALPRLRPEMTKSFLRPGETVTPIRLVEMPVPKKEEPPPERASAISDRNHTAERERLPKAPPGPQGPIGRPAPMDRIAALSPPQAPEDLVKPQEDHARRKARSPGNKA